MFARRALALLAISIGFATTLDFNGPVVTPLVREYSADGWTPKPTSKSRPHVELLRRQDLEEDPSFCGLLDGDEDEPIFCSTGVCAGVEESRWFGCCMGPFVEDCYVMTGCVESASLSECLDDPKCYNDEYVTVCDARTAPYCVHMYTTIQGESYGHFECGTAQTIYEVVSGYSLTEESSSGLFDIPVSETAEEDFSLTDEPTRTRSRFSFSLNLSTTAADEEETSTAEDESSTADGSVTESTTGSASQTAADALSSTTTTGAALRTGKAVLGAVGGVAGMIAMIL